MKILVAAVVALAALFFFAAVATMVHRAWSDRRSIARRERRNRNIAYQRAWHWLMRPRLVRLTDQRPHE